MKISHLRQPTHLSTPTAPTTTTTRRRRNVVAASASSSSSSKRDPASSLQLATARIPAKADRALFARSLFNWASTLTTNGRNLPLSLPLRVDGGGGGGGGGDDKEEEEVVATMSLLRVLGEAGSSPVSVADLVLSIEDVPETAAKNGAKENNNGVLFVRLFEGPGAEASRAPGAKVPIDARERIEKVLLPSLPDVDVIMTTMKNAIGVAAQVSLGQR